MLKRFFVLVALISTNWVTAASTPQWPFDQPSPDELHKSSKKVFIHYFTPFPISIDNRDPDNDYYAKGFISPDGEKGKHKSYGGYFRQRPLPRLQTPAQQLGQRPLRPRPGQVVEPDLGHRG